MGFGEHMAAGLGVLHGVLGESVSYVPSGGEARTILASVVLRDAQGDPGEFRREAVTRSRIVVQKHATLGVETVTLDQDRVVIGSKTYTVTGVANESAEHFTLNVEHVATEAARQRGRRGER